MNQLGQQPPRYTYLLNPFERDRITACPRCNAPLHDLEVALLILVEPNSPLILRLPCRHCAACDLLLVPEAELRRIAGARGVSAFVNEAVRQQLQAARLRQLLDTMEAESGPIPEGIQHEVDALAWPD